MPFTRCILALMVILAASPALAGGDVEAGKIVFKKCLLCHTNEPGKNKIGPSLFGVVGRHSATAPNFVYSPAMKAFDHVWDDAELDTYLALPQKVVPGTRMTFPGLPDEKDRQNVIAYLNTLK
jgi:cytochrome c